MKWLLLAGGGVVAVVLVALVIGWSLPVAHTTSQQSTFPASPDAIWKAITEVDAFPEWREDVKRVERLPDRDGRAVWLEEGSNGRLTFEVERREPPRLLSVRIADRSLPFGGVWTYEISPAVDGASLTITEHGEIYNPMFRVMARYVFGYDATLSAYFRALHRRVG
jgi:hypothetical protein